MNNLGAPDARLRSWLWGMLACYGLVVLACSSMRPLWLDEVIQLTVSSSHSVQDFMRRMGTNPGAAPLGYLTQRPLALAFGPAIPAARIPAALFSLLSCGVLLLILRELQLSKIAAAAAGLFLVLPLQFRYATEARPYSEALCFSLLAMLGVLKLAAKPSVGAACLLIAAGIATLYTQPYAILSVCGVIFWIALTNMKSGNWKHAVLPPLCLLLALLAYIPWYVAETRAWAQGIHDQGYPPFHWTAGLAMDVFKSLSGDGFLCSAALVFLAAAAMRGRENARARDLMLWATLFSVGGALAGDALKNYFFASRQILFAVPGLAILAALGFFELYSKTKLAACVATVLLVSALQKDVTMQMNSKEDWPPAARAVTAAAQGRCIQAVPSGTLELYDLFSPGLASKSCGTVPAAGGVALVSNLYTYASDLSAAQRRLQDQGFVPMRTITAGGTTITLEERQH